MDVGSLQQVLAAVASQIDARYAVFALGDRQSGGIHYQVSSPGDLRAESLLSPSWMNLVLDQDPGRFYRHGEIPGNAFALSQLNGARDVFDFQGGLYGSFLLKKSGFGYLAFCRAPGSPRFSDEDRGLLESLLPHVRQAIEINRQLQERSVLHDVMQERFDQLSTGVVLLDQSGRVVFSNAWARRLFREPGGINCEDGRLVVAATEQNDKLDQLIEHCIRTAHMKGVINDGYLSVSRGAQNKPPLAVSVSSYVGNLESMTLLARQSCVMLLLFDVERRRTARRYVLEELYNLTESEAMLATNLASGKTIKELAETNCMSRETLRSQLKRVFQKTNTNRQSDLVKLVLSGPGSLPI
ncbi:hypothetical protein [Haliea sp. E17]|uniref:helix-turn-helix transcriptional regulator n=1 Tax=Haliea sp. E17 TaxID=3401576 RepID=UPI003AAE7C86